MSQDLQDISNLIRNETDEGGNTKERIASAFDTVNIYKLDSGGTTKTGAQLDTDIQNIFGLIYSIEGGFNGIASVDIVNPSIEGYYISLSGGNFPNFGNITVPEGYSIIYYKDNQWIYENISLDPNNPILDTDFFN